MIRSILKVIVLYLMMFCFKTIFAVIKYPKSDIKLIIKYGFPGVGKTVDIVRESIRAVRKGRKVYTTAEDITVPGVLKVNPNDYGKYRLNGDCVLLLEEAGIYFNNRNWKNLDHIIEYSKLHRHDKCRIIIYSQSPEDTDVTLRRLRQEAWDMKKYMGCWSVQRKIICENTIVKSTNEDGQSRGSYGSNQRYSLGFKVYYQPFYYGFTDTHSMPSRFKQIPFERVPGVLPVFYLTVKGKLIRCINKVFRKSLPDPSTPREGTVKTDTLLVENMSDVGL